MSARPLCVVTGATGAIGPAVVDAFRADGYEVRTLSRNGDVRADITDAEGVRRGVAGADCVVHLAALLHVNNPPPSMREDYQRINAGGTENVVAAALKEGVRRIVHISTIAVYGYNTGQMLTEEDVPRPDTIYGETKLAAERIVADAGSVGTVLRLGAVYGARVKGNYRRLLLAMNRGRFLPFGAGTNRRTLVYDRDVARACVLAAKHPAAAGELFNVTDGEVHLVREILDAMATALGRRPPRIALPVWPVRTAAAVIETVSRATRIRPPVTRAIIDKYLEDVAVDGTKLRTRLGFEPAYDLQHGWRETVELMRAAGELPR